MEKIFKIPYFVLTVSILLSFVLFFLCEYVNFLVIPGIIIFFFSGWLLALRFLFFALGFYGVVLSSNEEEGNN